MFREEGTVEAFSWRFFEAASEFFGRSAVYGRVGSLKRLAALYAAEMPGDLCPVIRVVPRRLTRPCFQGRVFLFAVRFRTCTAGKQISN